MATPESIIASQKRAKAQEEEFQEEEFQERVRTFLVKHPCPINRVNDQIDLYQMLIEKILRMEEHIEDLQRIERRSRPLG